MRYIVDNQHIVTIDITLKIYTYVNYFIIFLPRGPFIAWKFYKNIFKASKWQMYFIGNHILPDEDLAAFHWSLLGPEHPLASLKVKCPISCLYIHA